MDIVITGVFGIPIKMITFFMNFPFSIGSFDAMKQLGYRNDADANEVGDLVDDGDLDFFL